jgi:hypothetical protein
VLNEVLIDFLSCALAEVAFLACLCFLNTGVLAMGASTERSVDMSSYKDL